MTDKMPCHITDGPSDPEDADRAWDRNEPDEDDAYEISRQREIDDARDWSTISLLREQAE